MSRYADIIHAVCLFCFENKIDKDKTTSFAVDILGYAGQIDIDENQEVQFVTKKVNKYWEENEKKS